MDNWRSKGKKEMGFSDHDDYPLLIINSSDNAMPAVDLSSKDSILTHLFNNGMIGSYKTHSAMEKQGLLMVQEVMEPAVDDLLTDTATLINLHARFRFFGTEKFSIETVDTFKAIFQRIYTFGRAAIARPRPRKSKQEIFERMQVAIDEFTQRIVAHTESNQEGGVKTG